MQKNHFFPHLNFIQYINRETVQLDHKSSCLGCQVLLLRRVHGYHLCIAFSKKKNSSLSGGLGAMYISGRGMDGVVRALLSLVISL